MKKLVTLMFGSLLALLLFAVPGDVVQASDECGCDTSEITGAERNKIVADILKSTEFKVTKAEHESAGYSMLGAEYIQVMDNHTYGFIMVGVPMTGPSGVIMLVFFNGMYVGDSPL